MPSNAIKIRGIVLNKTKLAEQDLIFTLLAQDGQQYRAVGKGARKPGNTFSTRVEVFSELDFMLAKGRNLDIIREVKLHESHEALRENFDINPFAYCGVELMTKITEPGNLNENFFPLLSNYLDELEKVPTKHLAKIFFASFLTKALIFTGVYPRVDSCVVCGRDFDSTNFAMTGVAHMSTEKGGYVCENCNTGKGIHEVSLEHFDFSDKIVFTEFKNLDNIPNYDDSIIDSYTNIMYKWLQYHFSTSLKSFKFL